MPKWGQPTENYALMDWQPEHQLQNGKYIIKEVLGKGGFGVTYKALLNPLNEQVVIKTTYEYRKNSSTYDQYVRQFEREGQKMAQLSGEFHPHIVRVRDWFVEDEKPYLVMDFVPGKDLFKVVRSKGRLPEAEAIGCIQQIGDALVTSHHMGLVHRDIHPGNIILRRKNHAVLIDFGLAKEIVPSTISSTGIGGNRGFAPYEQLVRGSREPNVDVYGLAATLYYVVTGQCPLDSYTRKIDDSPLIAPQEIVPHLSKRLNEAIVQGIALEAKDRPQSMQDWLRLLEAPREIVTPVETPSPPSPPPAPARTEPKEKNPIPSETPKVVSPPNPAPAPKKAGSRKKTTPKPVSLKPVGTVQRNAPSRNPMENVTRARFLRMLGTRGAVVVITVVGGSLARIIFSIQESEQDPTQESKIDVRKPQIDFNNLPKLPNSASAFEFEAITVNNKGKIVNRQSHQAQSFTEDLGNEVKLEMVAILSGTFWMGSPETEEGRDDDESPQHEVKIAPFFIGKYEITQEQWKAVAALPKIERDLEPDPSKFKGVKRPVEQVSWYDAEEFCKRLSKQTGREYRLPSEAEWEYACRAGTTTPFHFGETITIDLANYDGNYIYANAPKGKYRQQTTEVGSFSPNTFGLYDMHGNVREWCADHWHDNYNGAPDNKTIWLSGNKSNTRLLRGGSWNDNPWYCRSANRGRYAPGYRYDVIGFRVACVAART
ncbi:SUMF1/EgtB/PvdO family nonheme iron enzyme [Lusitaniella coriacea]|uniref:SUMF1/EgtB/PvdO family nonheme iron enzyme n=1 Tax=Lusitaniella coriacea TaxID=1983105 RepID=UPI003CE990DE